MYTSDLKNVQLQLTLLIYLSTSTVSQALPSQTTGKILEILSTHETLSVGNNANITLISLPNMS